MEKLVVGGFNGKFWRLGMFYTALSYSTSAAGLFLPGFDPRCMKANLKGQVEMDRIRQETFTDFHHDRLDFFNKFPQNEWEYVLL